MIHENRFQTNVTEFRLCDCSINSLIFGHVVDMLNLLFIKPIIDCVFLMQKSCCGRLEISWQGTALATGYLPASAVLIVNCSCDRCIRKMLWMFSFKGEVTGSGLNAVIFDDADTILSNMQSIVYEIYN